MATKRKYVVRVVEFTHDFMDKPTAHEVNPFWLEQLRYMGHITWHVRDEQVRDATRPEGEHYLYKQVFDFHAPQGHDSKIWAEQNAARMQSFKINAVAAPAWTGAGVPSEFQ